MTGPIVADAKTTDDDDDAKPAWVTWASRALIVIALVAMGATIWMVGPRTILSHLQTIGWWFAAILAIEVVITMLDAAAVYSVARGKDDAVNYSHVLVAQVAGRAVNAVTPGGSLGEALKASVLTEAIPTNRAVAAVIYCNLASLIYSLLLVAVGAPLTALFLDLPQAFTIGLVVAGILAAVAAVGLAILVRRGMLSSLVGVGAKLGVISKKRQRRWKKRLDNIDERLSGTAGGHRRKVAAGFVLCSKLLTWASMWLILAAAGYQASPGEIAAMLSAGVVLGWLGAIVPMGLGVAEGGNYALFHALGAPPTFGVALALARRVNQIIYAAVGFAVLGIWRLTTRGVVRPASETR